jgi:hypothetical protein
MFEGVRTWATDRPRAAVGIGASVLALVALLVIAMRGGDDVAPAIGSDVGQQAPVPAQQAAPPDGTVVAEQQGTGTGPAPASGSAPAAADTGPVNVPQRSSEERAAESRAFEDAMNEGLEPVVLSPTPKDTPEDVAFVGRKLQIVAAQVQACLDARRGDIFACLDQVPDGYTINRVFESEPQGAQIVVDGAEGVKLTFRGGVLCRSLGDSQQCDDWSAPDA